MFGFGLCICPTYRNTDLRLDSTGSPELPFLKFRIVQASKAEHHETQGCLSFLSSRFEHPYLACNYYSSWCPRMVYFAAAKCNMRKSAHRQCLNKAQQQTCAIASVSAQQRQAALFLTENWQLWQGTVSFLGSITLAARRADRISTAGPETETTGVLHQASLSTYQKQLHGKLILAWSYKSIREHVRVLLWTQAWCKRISKPCEHSYIYKFIFNQHG